MQNHRFKPLGPLICLGAQAALGFSYFVALPSYAQRSSVDKKFSEGREIHNTFSGPKDKGTILEATNPMELINRLRDAKAMDNATPPSDAIDEALRAFDDMDLGNSTF